MQQINNDRWQINKIGLINYWWYDEEEFYFEDGKMILRGTNGSGKSVTMQSFIPLLLDGKKSPERLDPFGNKARKIEDYILGYGDDIKEENTSYLYIEFYRKKSNTYRTIGMGLRAKKNQGVKFWGFVIKDGRRVGKDILLYKDTSSKIPLTKTELKNRIGTGGEVVESQKDYETMVNNNIFGFETLEEYDEFIKLLIEIRTPKLSNGKGFRPSTVIEILSNSLRPLSDEDLRPVSESIDNMNKTKEQLEFLRQSKKAIDKIKNYYKEYNNYILYSKAKMYKNETKQCKNVGIQYDNLKEEIAYKKEELLKTKKQIEDLEAKIKAVYLQEENLRNSKAWNLQNQLNEIEKNLKTITSQIFNKQEKIDALKQEEIKQENILKDIKQEYELILEDFNNIKEELSYKAKELDYHEYFYVIEDIEKNINQKYEFDNFKKNIKIYIEKIEQAKVALQDLKDVERIYDQAENELEIVKNSKLSKDNEVTKLRLLRDEEKSKMADELYAWEKANELLKLSNEEKIKIVQKIEEYSENSTYDDIVSTARNVYTRYNDSILQNIVKYDYETQKIKNDIESKKVEIEQWKNKKEKEPYRDEKVLQNRENLKKANIHFLPFYKTVDFKKDVPDKIKNAIESALKDMGILDSLVIPKNQLEYALKLDEGFVDKYIIPSPVDFKHDLSYYMCVSLPEDSKLSRAQIDDILRTILIADKSSKNYLDESGYYQIGLLRGKADLAEDAKYIGHENRKKFKQFKVLELEEELTTLKINKEELESLKEQLLQKQIKLNEEFLNFPKKDMLEQKEQDFKIAIHQLEAIKLEVLRKEEELKQKYENIKEKRKLVEESVKGFSFKVTLEAYTVAKQLSSEFIEQIFELEKIQNNLVSISQREIIIAENLERILKDLDDLLYEENRLDINKNELEEKRNALSKILEEGNDLAIQMQECLRLKEDLPNKKDIETKKEGSLEADISNKEEKLESLKEIVEISKKKQDIAKNIFAEELKLGLVINSKEEMQNNAVDCNNSENIDELSKVVITKYNYLEKQGKGKSEYLDNLMISVRENQEYLVDYNLSVETLFLDEIKEENSEIISILNTRSRKDITCFVKGRKVNFLMLSKEVNDSIEETENLIEEDDRRLFEEILTNTVGRKIRERIYHAKDWVNSMNKLMETIDTSSKLSFSLNWKPKAAADENEIGTKELVDILNADSRILKQEEISKVASHFREKFQKAEQRVKELGVATTFHDIIKDTLDYRNWFEFQFNYKKGIDSKKELTNNAFFKLSGGEKAMAMYIPLFAAVTSKFHSASEYAPRIISLDEAFAGVDDLNIRDMFRILTNLELEYIINSQVLWGEYDTIEKLAINELISDPEEKVVSVIRYIWNGKKRELII